MKQEDIDKRIGMPDVDAEWAKFEREVIGKKTTSRRPLYWGLGIAASIALVAGVFLFGYNTGEPRQIIAQQTAPTQQISSAEEKAIEKPVESTASPEKDVPPIVETEQRSSSGLLATKEDLQGHIAGLNIFDIPDSVKQARRDSLLRQREIRMDSMLIVVNGTPIPLYKFKPNGVATYLYKQHQLLSDSDLNVEERISRGVYIPYVASEEERKRRCFETYGDRAKYGVVEISTVPDKYCDEYINKHPELKKERHHIEGYVYDEDDNKPLADTWVHIQHKGIGAVTDSKGYFSIWLPQTNDTLQAFHIGYRRVRFVQPADTITIRMRSAVKIRDVKVLPKKEFEKYKGGLKILMSRISRPFSFTGH